MASSYNNPEDYIAWLITEFHGGQIRAENRKDSEGVVITVVIPLFYD